MYLTCKNKETIQVSFSTGDAPVLFAAVTESTKVFGHCNVSLYIS